VSSAKRRCIRLDVEAYQKLHRQILERDGWRCQACGSLRGLEVHHAQLRSQAGDDSEHNLITPVFHVPPKDSLAMRWHARES